MPACELNSMYQCRLSQYNERWRMEIRIRMGVRIGMGMRRGGGDGFHEDKGSVPTWIYSKISGAVLSSQSLSAC